MPSAETSSGRKRKAHTKSRRGCGNCKLRRIKCDEAQPECKKCQAYGVSCSYDGEGSNELQHSGEGAFRIEPAVPDGGTLVDFGPQNLPTPPNEFPAGMLGYGLTLHDTEEVYRITEKDMDIFRRFRERTAMTIGTAQTVDTYRDAIGKLGCGHSYLTHVMFAMVLMHDRYLSDDPWGPPSNAETFHHYHGTAIFNSMLSKPIAHEEKDAMWGAAALLGAITLASMDATTPEESWPLAPSSPSDLDWLRMSDGKKEVWRLADPTREDSIWRSALQFDYKKAPTPQTYRRPEVETLIPHLTDLYGVDDLSKEAGDPYHTAASIIMRLLPIQCTHSTILYFLSFLGHMDPAFKQLLHQKDPKAMLLLAWWHAKLLDYSAWWLQRRATLECKAICMYLQR
ncbi:hypothetical protein LTR36_007879 [Oleoguttula mirabilis]|uniref:Zn(2)-C6 fungal-type domain-containing protein n=1 Tax=Oleoguttula mirabilis TaxID=1507867 RepID=A0AAV9J917_9PEZI|nr:hypothetical protein LTR36_007879 [Oleoguttula mirabilis]